MREYRIDITQFEFLSIFSLTVDKEINDHACAIVSGLISDENASVYRVKLMKDVWVLVSAVAENGQSKKIMAGIISGFTIDCVSQQKTLTLKIMSGTWLMDGAVHFRTFQNNSLTYAQVMAAVGKGYTDSDFIGIDAVNMPIGGLLLQYLETDWEFLRRIASQFGSYLIPSTAHIGAKYYVGRKTGGNYRMPDGVPYTAKKYVGEFMGKSSSGLGALTERDYLECCFQSRDIFDLCDHISLDTYTGYICKIHSEYTGAELVHTYFLRSEHGMACIPPFNRKHVGCSFDAVIREVKQDVVRIDVTDDE
ncbi:MAG: phage late control D family protein, partial [Oscillospiraceae bacterium]|nr:phage late control D family protein [Oscillospiraceae bacterium]